jgi:hypothetical protein
MSSMHLYLDRQSQLVVDVLRHPRLNFHRRQPQYGCHARPLAAEPPPPPRRRHRVVRVVVLCACCAGGGDHG